MRNGKTALVSAEFPEIIENLEEFIDSVIPVHKNPYLPAPVACHADMNYFDIDDTLFAAGGSECVNRLFDVRKYVRMLDDPGSTYPFDVICNAKVMGKHLFCNVRTISNEVLSYAKDNNYGIVDVRQGYAGCSICKVTDEAIITSDIGIRNAAEKIGIEVLMIDNSEIILPGYDVGFIGGCTGIDSDRLYFTGSLSKCSFGNVMKDFCEDHGVRIIELTDDRPIDVGGIMIL